MRISNTGLLLTLLRNFRRKMRQHRPSDGAVMVLICLILAAPSVPTVAADAAAEKTATTPGSPPSIPDGEPLDVSKIKERYWSLCEDQSGVVQNRSYAKSDRAELSLLAGKLLGVPFLSPYAFGLTLGYHFSEILSMHVVGWQAVSSPFTPPLFSTDGVANTNPISHYLGGEARVNLLYGKLSLAGVHDFRFDIFASAGAGALTTGSGTVLAWSLGIGQQFHLSSALAINLDFRWLHYPDTILEGQTGGMFRWGTCSRRATAPLAC